MADFRFRSATKLLDHVLSLDYFQPEGKKPPPISYHRVPGKDPLVVMVGDNASGKSFARRCVTAVAQKNKVESIHLSMEGRTGGMSGLMKAMVYGDEDWRSTGENSIATIVTGIKTCEGRENDHVIFWDEPDVGLSDSWAAGVGVAIRKFVQSPPVHTLAIFVVTHRKALVAQLLDADPTYVYFGEEGAPESLADWVDQPIVPRDIETLADLSHKRFQRIQKILNAVDKRKTK